MLTKTPFVLKPAPMSTTEVEPEATRIRQALAFYQHALKSGPRLTSEVMREGRQRGLSDRTQWRARYLLNVQALHLPGMGARWLIALPTDTAVAVYKQGKKAKTLHPSDKRPSFRNRAEKEGELDEQLEATKRASLQLSTLADT